MWTISKPTIDGWYWVMLTGYEPPQPYQWAGDQWVVLGTVTVKRWSEVIPMPE